MVPSELRLTARETLSAPLRDEGNTVLLASSNATRTSFLASLPGVQEVIALPGGPESPTAQPGQIARSKALYALNNLQGGQPDKVVGLFAQDNMNEGQGRPEHAERILRTFQEIYDRGLKTGKYYYTAESATVFVHGVMAETRTTRMTFDFNPRRLLELCTKSELFQHYFDVCQTLFNLQPVHVAGGLCFEGLMALRLLDQVDGVTLTDELSNTILTKMYHATAHLRAGFPPQFLHHIMPARHLGRRVRTPATEELLVHARQTQAAYGPTYTSYRHR